MQTPTFWLSVKVHTGWPGCTLSNAVPGTHLYIVAREGCQVPYGGLQVGAGHHQVLFCGAVIVLTFTDGAAIEKKKKSKKGKVIACKSSKKKSN